MGRLLWEMYSSRSANVTGHLAERDEYTSVLYRHLAERDEYTLLCRRDGNLIKQGFHIISIFAKGVCQVRKRVRPVGPDRLLH